MSAHLKPREMGAVLECDGCDARIVTGQIEKRLIRAYAATLGWGRGLLGATRKRLGTKRNDYCPPCYATQKATAAEEKLAKAERKAKRKANKLARLQSAKVLAGVEVSP